jgi:hypothetical protein
MQADKQEGPANFAPHPALRATPMEREWFESLLHEEPQGLKGTVTRRVV